MKNLFILFLIIFGVNLFAYDCSNVKPFRPLGKQKANTYVGRLHWENGEHKWEDICIASTEISWFDVRGREEEAFYCLPPDPTQIIQCDTKLNGDDAQILVVPASWIRHWKPTDVREYHFHAVITKKSDPGFFNDIFSRTLSSELGSQNLIVEGALKTGPSNPDDGFFIRVEFKN